MASNTTPPASDNVTQIYLSDTFYTWYKKTNDLITKVNPIELYSITADVVHGSDGVTLAVDGDGNWTIGYILPASIPNGHTFQGDINFAAGVSGEIVNTFNGSTGEVTGVETISGSYTTTLNDGNVQGVPMIINGVTASTAGSLTLDASDIPNTLSHITGPAGYIITSEGGAGGTMGWTIPMFIDVAGVSGNTNEAMQIDVANSKIVVGTDTSTGTIGGHHYSLEIQGNSGGIYSVTESTMNDILLHGDGNVKANDTLRLMCGAGDGEGVQIMTGVAAGGTHGVHTNVILFDEDGSIGLGSGIDRGTDGQVLLSKGPGVQAQWNTISAGNVTNYSNLASQTGPFGYGDARSYGQARRNLTNSNAYAYVDAYITANGFVIDPFNLSFGYGTVHTVAAIYFTGGSGHGYGVAQCIVVPPGWYYYGGFRQEYSVGWSGVVTDPPAYEDVPAPVP